MVSAGPRAMDEPAARLEADGFAFVAARVDEAAIGRMLAACDRRLTEARAALGSREIGIGSVAGYTEIVQRSPGRWDVPFAVGELGVEHRDMPWWPLVATVLGEDAEVPYSGVVASDPGSPSQHWHTDSPHVAADHRPPHALNVLVALHDIPMRMGPTELARGSHVLTNHHANPRLVVEELIYQHESTTPESVVDGTAHAVPERVARELAAGSCLVFDDRLLHRGLANRSDRIRHVAYVSYCRSGYTTDTYFETSRSLSDPAF